MENRPNEAAPHRRPAPRAVARRDDVVIRFRHVTKEFYLHNPVAEGFKNLVLHLPTHLRALWRRKPFYALHDVSFDVYRGECLSVIGHNGSGKSTTLGLVAGVVRPTRGTVQTKGRICPLLELGAGFHHELTGRENILLNGILLGLTRREILDRVDEIIAFSELESFIDVPLRTYSSGMVARLGFSVAVHVEPEILLIDEVLAVGDERFQKKCIARMREFKARNTTMIFVTHDMGAVSQISDRVALIEQGRLIAVDETSRIVNLYRQRAAQAA
jgi:lipopolysaccharide transport system ATP-binding protein